MPELDLSKWDGTPFVVEEPAVQKTPQKQAVKSQSEAVVPSSQNGHQEHIPVESTEIAQDLP